MKQCLSVTFSMDLPKDFLQTIVQKYAQDLHLEGTAQRITDDQIRIIICGEREAVDTFVDLFHKAIKNNDLGSLEIEPFLKERDYRGVFRVIE
jgi:acylphosphatase